MISRDFILAGRAVFTVRVPAKWAKDQVRDSWTFRVCKKPPSDKYPRETYFVSYLAGPDNEEDYQYLGILEPTTGRVKLTRASSLTDESFIVRMIRWFLSSIWKDEGREIEKRKASIDHAGRCGRCARLLTTPESIDTGFGPECSRKLGIEWGRTVEDTEELEPEPELMFIG